MCGEQAGSLRRPFRRQQSRSLSLYHRLLFLLAAGAWCLASASCFAAGSNLFRHGSFERVSVLANLWDGVDSQRRLTVQTRSQPIIIEGARSSSVPFPCSPNFVDLDGDGLKDLVVGDAAGFIWWYKNYGAKGQPVFKTGQFLQSFYGPACKLHVVDWNSSGTPDLLIGDSQGNVYAIPNIGNKSEPKFTSSMAKPRIGVYGHGNDQLDTAPIKCGRSALLIGNFACPWVADWNGDNRPDLIIGEGTYSANSVWVFLNSGSAQNPLFEPTAKFPLAYGEGKEQLTPAVCDWDGDGTPDLIVGEREGRLSLFRGKRGIGAKTVAAIQGRAAPDVLDFTSHIPVGGKTNLWPMVYAYPCDWNDDSLTDLLFGRADGRIQIALNKGKQGAPVIGDPQYVLGTDVEKDTRQPVGWSYSYSSFSNSAFLPEATESEPGPAGERILAKHGKYFLKFEYVHGYAGYNMWWEASPYGPQNWLSRSWELGGKALHTSVAPVVIGNNYTLSFWYRGVDMKINWLLGIIEVVENPSRRGTGSYEVHKWEGNLGPSGGWQQFTRTGVIPGSKGSRGEALPFEFFLQFIGTGTVYLDDFQLVAAQ